MSFILNGNPTFNDVVINGDLTVNGTTTTINSTTFNAATINVTGDATFDTNTLFVDSTNNEVGIGTITPEGKLHVITDDVSVAPVAAADTLVVEGTNPGMSILGTDGSNINLYFGSASQNPGALARWNHDTNLFELGTNNSGAELQFKTAGFADVMRIDAAGDVGIGTTTPTSTAGSSRFVDISTTSTKAGFALTNTTNKWEVQNNSSGNLQFLVGGSNRMIIENAGDVGIGTASPDAKLEIENATATTGLLIDQNGNGPAFLIDTEATTNHGIEFTFPAQTTGDVLRVTGCNSLTTGHIANFQSNSASTSTRNLVEIVNDNTLATGTIPLKIQQDAAQTALDIDINGNGIALGISSDATTQPAISVGASAITTGKALFMESLNALTTGKIASFHSNSADTSTRNLIEIVNDNTLATGARCLKIQQDANNKGALIQKSGTGGDNALEIIDAGTGNGVLIDKDGNGVALRIDTEATSQSGIEFSTPAQTTGTVLRVDSCDSLTTGGIALFESDSADTGTRNLVEIINNNTLATGARCLNIQQDANAFGLVIDQNGNGPALSIDTEATSQTGIEVVSATQTTGNILQINNAGSLTTGKVALFHSNSTSTSTRRVVEMHNDSPSATNTETLRVIQDAANQATSIQQNAASSFIDYVGTAAGNATDPISTFTTSGATTNHIQIEINGVKAWIAVSTNDPTA